MPTTPQTVDFFLGANGPEGFVSFFETLRDPLSRRLYYLKGSPGSGKSTLLKAFAARHPDEPLLERIHCSSDPDSLDGVLLTEGHCAVLDATPPHALEPKYPLAAEELVNLLAAADPAPAMAQRDTILSLSEIIAGYHRHFCRKLAGANLLFAEARALLQPQLDGEKLKRQALRTAKREFAAKSLARGTEQIRLLSAFTPKGLWRYHETARTLCSRLYLLEDEARLVAPAYLALLRQKLLDLGASFYACRSPYQPETELEGLLIPSLSLGFLTVHRKLPAEALFPARVIHSARFLSGEISRDTRSKLRFYRKTAESLLQDGIESLEKAKAVHDRLEACYHPCFAYEKVSALLETLP